MAGLFKNAMMRLSALTRLSGTPVPMAARAASPRAVATAATAAAAPRTTLGKKDLVAAVALKAELDKEEAENAVNTVLETIMETVAKGTKVQVVGFGTFEARLRAARKGRNPSTGAELDIPETTVPAFSAGKVFKQRVKEGHGHGV